VEGARKLGMGWKKVIYVHFKTKKGKPDLVQWERSNW